MKFNLKLISLLLILFFVSLSAVSAHDTAQTNDTVSEIEANIDEIETNNIDGIGAVNIEEIASDDTTAGPSGFNELQQQIWRATAGDTIELDNDYIYDGVRPNGITIDKQLTLDGKGHTLNANHSAIFYIQQGITNVVFKNIIFINGEKNNGGAIFADDGTDYLTIDNCTFKDNKATGSVGGALLLNGNHLTITNNIFENNFAQGSGGAIYIAGADITVEKNTFINNHANSLAGAIRWNGADTNSGTIKENIFEKNDAETGGAVFFEGNGISIISNTFNNHKTTSGAGGTLNIKGDNAVISKNNITNSYSNSIGGAIYLEGKSPKMTNNFFTKCSSKDNGAAAYINGASATISDNRFIDNNAGDMAGALLLKSSNANITNNEFKSNVAKSGGVAFIEGDGTAISKNTFADNKATDTVGGAVFIKGHYSKITDNTFENNFAQSSGGAIRLEGNSSVISNSVFTANQAPGTLGGAICALGHDILITTNTFTKNLAGRDGGAVFVEGTQVEDMGIGNIVTNNVFIENKVSGNIEGCHGGAISMAGESCAITDNNFTRNHADNIGGAIRWNGDKSAMGDLTGNRFESNDAPSGGAVYISGHGINICKNTFSNDYATDYVGGAINIKGNNGVISENEIIKSKSKSSGGAIYVEGDNTKVIDNYVFMSSSGDDAGVAYISGASAAITGNRFINNTAGQLAGVLLLKSNNANIKNNEFSGNTAKSTGGVAFIEGSKITIEKNIFKNNLANGLAGAIRWNGASSNSGTIKENQFENNIGANGGAIFFEGNGLTISKNTFNGHKSTSGAGGTINIKGNSVEISENTITDSESNSIGGAIFIEGKSAKLLNNEIRDCTSKDNGGAAYINGASATLTGNKFIENNAGDLAGALLIKSSNANIKNNEFTSNVAKSSGGAAYIEGAKITLQSNTFTKNQAGKTSVGGAIRFSGNDAIIKNNKFISNTVGTGTAYYGSGENPTITSNTISPNNANSKRWEKTKTKLTTPTKTFKKSAKTKKITITLKSATNKVLKNKKITLKVNKKTYTGKTNSKGQATITVKLTKKGTYKYTAKFAGDTYYYSISKNGKIIIK